MQAEEDMPFQKGDLESVMAAHPHVARWVRDFEERYGSRPVYYGPLDRDARKMKPLNLIYITKEPIFVHIYQPPTDGDEISQTSAETSLKRYSKRRLQRRILPQMKNLRIFYQV
ncbi:MAG: hypothetical protein ACPHK2_03920 [Candidatus Poseidoniaceae archaeon]